MVSFLYVCRCFCFALLPDCYNCFFFFKKFESLLLINNNNIQFHTLCLFMMFAIILVSQSKVKSSGSNAPQKIITERKKSFSEKRITNNWIVGCEINQIHTLPLVAAGTRMDSHHSTVCSPCNYAIFYHRLYSTARRSGPLAGSAMTESYP